MKGLSCQPGPSSPAPSCRRQWHHHIRSRRRVRFRILRDTNKATEKEERRQETVTAVILHSSSIIHQREESQNESDVKQNMRARAAHGNVNYTNYVQQQYIPKCSTRHVRCCPLTDRDNREKRWEKRQGGERKRY